MVNVVIEFLDVLERKYTQSFEIALSMEKFMEMQ